MSRLATAYRDVVRCLRIYGRVPKRFRSPRRLLLVSVVSTSTWFSALFGSLAWQAWQTSLPTSAAYSTAAALGVVAVVLVLLHRAEAGVATLACMLALGQTVAVVPVLAALAR